VSSGIVIAVENKEVILDALRQEEDIRIEKEIQRRENEVLARWKKFLIGLRIRKRLGIVYGEHTEGDVGRAPSEA
jgi:xeroderma pigmentosum group C-complementing protein